nr:MAG TPA: hypothetical protein [Caudoviricetes sp.]
MMPRDPRGKKNPPPDLPSGEKEQNPGPAAEKFSI